MSNIPPISTGLLRDLNLQNLIPDLPGPLDEAVRGAVDLAVNIVDRNPSATPPPVVAEPWNQAPAPVPPGTPQPHIKADTVEDRNELVKGIDTALGAIGLLLNMRWLVPDPYEKPLEGLVKVLQIVRSWVD